MKIHLVDWLELEKLRDAAMKALEDYDFLLLNVAMRHHGEEATMLMKARDDVDTARLHLASFDCTPQSEWMGGPTYGPGSENTKTYMREPNCVRTLSSRRYFTKEEVEAAKCLGLLQGGRDLTGPEK